MQTDPRDRSVMLLVLGIIQIVLAGLSGLCALFMGLSVLMMNSRLPAADTRGYILSFLLVITYLLPAANLLVTGVGTVRFRPWARMATIVSSGIWLGLGALMTVSMVFVSLSPSVGLPGRGESIILAVMLTLPLIGLPITLLVLYTRPGVRETFARRSQPGSGSV